MLAEVGQKLDFPEQLLSETKDQDMLMALKKGNFNSGKVRPLFFL